MILDLWKERLSDFTSIAKKAISLSDFVKVSDEEVEIITQALKIMS